MQIKENSLSEKKYERLAGPIPAVSFEKLITETIHAIMQRQVIS
ncbi:hypothetical protein [Bacillus atrophaeus]|nr:hypothetical protein [Bacillus atrophaeus]MEC0934425.1 hypothetical protein [Bacillus atrophaeus]MED4807711.1 hypothetical protein [Bacillus atrophaeus]